MIEVEALDFTQTFEIYDDFRGEEKTTLLDKYSALLGVSTSEDFESIYKEAYDYVMQTIYNYYDNYYLTSATKDRFLTLLGTILSGKLPAYKVMYDNYLDARNQTYSTLGGRKTKSSGGGSGSSSGGQTFANTPEVIDSGVDYVDQYSTSKNKYSNSRSDKYEKEYTETLNASVKQLWENVKSIPDDIYKEVITITAKLFFSETMEERSYPCAYMTLTKAVEELQKKQVTGIEQDLLDTYDLVTTITTDALNFTKTTSLKVFKDIADAYYEENKERIDTLTGRMEEAESDIEGLKVKTNNSVKNVTHDYDTSTRKLTLRYTLNDDTIKTSTLTLPLCSLTNSGLMTAEQFSKLDQVVLYGTNFVPTGRKFAVQQDEDHDLYVEVPEDTYDLPIASGTTLGGIKVGKNLSIDADGTLNASDGEGFTAGDGLETDTSGVTKVKVDSLTTNFNASKQVEVLTDGESIQAGASGLEVKVDNSTIKIGDNGLEVVSGGSGGSGLESTGNTNVSLWEVSSGQQLFTPAYSVTSISYAANKIYFFSNGIEIGYTGYTDTQTITLPEMNIEDFVCVILSMSNASSFTGLSSIYAYYTHNRLFVVVNYSDGTKEKIECNTTFYIRYYKLVSTYYYAGMYFVRKESTTNTKTYSGSKEFVVRNLSAKEYVHNKYDGGTSYGTIYSGYEYNYIPSLTSTTNLPLIYKVKKDSTWF